MSESPPYPEDRDPDDRLMDWGAAVAKGFIDHLVRVLAAERYGVSALRWLVRRYLVPAEALLRRAIYLLSAQLPPLTGQPRPKTPARPRKGGSPHPSSPPQKPRTPTFRLTEPLPRPRTDHIPLSRRPRISIAGEAPPARPAPEPAALEDLLRRRIAAFQDAYDDPWKAAGRLQRLRARPAPGTPTLSLVKTPGARAVDDTTRTLMSDLNALLERLHAARSDTS